MVASSPTYVVHGTSSTAAVHNERARTSQRRPAIHRSPSSSLLVYKVSQNFQTFLQCGIIIALNTYFLNTKKNTYTMYNFLKIMIFSMKPLSEI